MKITKHIIYFICLSVGLLTIARLFMFAQTTSQIHITGPIGSGQFGQEITVLPNGNIVVIDPYFDAGAIVDVGAVYLYDGATGDLISMLTGSAADDQIGSDGIITLSNGNFLLRSPYWDNGIVTDTGAVTWINGLIGLAGVVSSTNSLVGSSVADQKDSTV